VLLGQWVVAELGHRLLSEVPELILGESSSEVPIT
jgi:hypothetical protein